ANLAVRSRSVASSDRSSASISRSFAAVSCSVAMARLPADRSAARHGCRGECSIGIKAATSADFPPRSAAEEAHRVDRLSALADFEVELRAEHGAGLADAGDGLAALHLVALLHQQRGVVGIGGDVAAVMPDQDHI